MMRPLRRSVGLALWVGNKELKALHEDIIFVQDVTRTTLREYLPLFKARFIDGLSIRKTAEELGINRGSVEYSQKKFYGELAVLLQQRDERDDVSRLEQKFV